MWVCGQFHASATSPLENSHGIHCTGGLVGLRASTDNCGENKTSCLHWGSNQGMPSHTTYTLPAPPLTSPLYPKLIKIKNLKKKKKSLPTLQPLLVLNFYSRPFNQSKQGDSVSKSFISVCNECVNMVYLHILPQKKIYTRAYPKFPRI